MKYSADTKNKILEKFVTSATDNIYAIRHNIPVEMFGAFGSYFSRNPKDFREHLWDAITGQIEKQETEVNEDSLRWLVNDDYKEPADVIKRGLAKSQDFFRRWYGKYSHKSIANTVWIPMVATNVSQLFAKELAYDQLAFFIEQSTRYVRWDTKKMYKDEDIMASPHKQLYTETLETMAKNYNEFTDQAVIFYENSIPFDAWLKQQKEATLMQDNKIIRTKYSREIKNAALDVARFLLPQAIQTNIAWILDARSTEFDIAAWKGHPLEEIVEAAEMIEKHAGEIVPSLLKYTEFNSYYGEKLNNYVGFLCAGPAEPFKKGVDIISYDEDSLDKTIAHLLKKHNRGGTFNDRYQHAGKLSFDDKMHILEKITHNRKKHDEWIEMDEDFDLVKIAFEIRTDIGAIRDWRRHQKWDRGEALYTLDNGYHTPYMLDGMSQRANDIFDKTMEAAHKAEKKIRNDLYFQSQYIVPMAAMHAITMSAGLDQLQYMIWTRTTPEGNFSYREDAFKLAEEAVKKMPWLLGYKEYPKEKDFITIYKQAPLKSLLRLQLGETSLHQ